MEAYRKIEGRTLFTKNEGDIVIACHRCMRSLNKEAYLAKCDNSRATPCVSSTVLTDPFIYNHRVLNESLGRRPDNKFLHPYLVYYL